jgi:hypothetical protein
MRQAATRTGLLAFAACYLAVGGFLALGWPGNGAFRLTIALFWPCLFRNAGTAAALAVFLGLALYMRAMRLRLSTRQCDIRDLALGIAELRRQLAQAHDRAQALERTTALPLAGDGRSFALAKRAFARLNHPDRAAGEPAERRIRAELFKEYWGELQRIEDAARAARAEP